MTIDPWQRFTLRGTREAMSTIGIFKHLTGARRGSYLDNGKVAVGRVIGIIKLPIGRIGGRQNDLAHAIIAIAQIHHKARDRAAFNRVFQYRHGSAAAFDRE
ncbi:hypothetical protein D3C81_1204120 [compost metagenome]